MCKPASNFQFGFGKSLHFYLRFPGTGEWHLPSFVEWIGIASERRGFYPFWQNYEALLPGCRIVRGLVLDEREVTRLARMTGACLK